MSGGLIHDSLVRAARDDGRRSAVRAGDDQWSFADLDRKANAFARHLTERGVGAGDRVAVMTTNRFEFIVAVEAVSKVGAASVLISPAWKAAEVGAAADLTTPCHAVTDAGATAIFRDRLGADAVTDLDGEAVVDADSSRDSEAVTPPSTVTVDDEAILVFSSGTTGLPKAVRHTHRSIGRGTAHWVSALGLGPEDRFQIATPPSHILGLLNLLAAIEAGASVRLHARFDLDEVLAPHRVRPHHARDGGGADRAGHRRPSPARGLRPVVAPLHHVGRDTRDRERRRGPSRHAPGCGGCRPTGRASCR